MSCLFVQGKEKGHLAGRNDLFLVLRNEGKDMGLNFPEHQAWFSSRAGS